MLQHRLWGVRSVGTTFISSPTAQKGLAEANISHHLRLELALTIPWLFPVFAQHINDLNNDSRSQPTSSLNC